MQTRKNRKNDETSYEKMLKLRRDLTRAVTLLELVKRREKTKREYVHLTVEVFEKRFQARDFSGAIISELSALKATRPAFTPIFQNHYNPPWSNKAIVKDEVRFVYTFLLNLFFDGVSFTPSCVSIISILYRLLIWSFFSFPPSLLRLIGYSSKGKTTVQEEETQIAGAQSDGFGFERIGGHRTFVFG